MYCLVLKLGDFLLVASGEVTENFTGNLSVAGGHCSHAGNHSCALAKNMTGVRTELLSCELAKLKNSHQ